MRLGDAEVRLMAKINLLPHREARRKQRKAAFYVMLGMGGALGAAVVLLVAVFYANRISNQEDRNNFIKAEIAKLDVQIKEISSLKEEIEALQARQQAVEDLQADRNQPVYLMDELVQQTPEGIYLKSFKQEGQRVVLTGYAQSNERISELLRNLGNNSKWLERPDLVEIRAASLGQGRDAKKVFDFTVNVGIKRPRDQDKSEKSDKSDKPAPAGAPAAKAVTAASKP
jgi:type IV pilus assembly protein PilN